MLPRLYYGSGCVLMGVLGGLRYFKSDKGFLNADINGAINILRRFVNDNDFVKGLISSNHIFNPKRLKLAEICCKQRYCALGFG